MDITFRELDKDIWEKVRDVDGEIRIVFERMNGNLYEVNGFYIRDGLLIFTETIQPEKRHVRR